MRPSIDTMCNAPQTVKSGQIVAENVVHPVDWDFGERSWGGRVIRTPHAEVLQSCGSNRSLPRDWRRLVTAQGQPATFLD